MNIMKKFVAVVLAVMLMVPSVVLNAAETVDSPSLTDISEVSISISDFTYNGKMTAPSYSVSYQGTSLVRGTDFTLAGLTHQNTGTYTVTFTGIGKFTGTTTATYSINKKDGISAKAVRNLPYIGQWQRGKANVTCGGKSLKEGRDFQYVSGLTHFNAGTYTVTVKGIGNYTGTATYTYKINKVAQTLKDVQRKTISVNKKAVTVTPAKGYGKVTYKVVVINPNNKKYVSVNPSTGKITIKKGATKGTYRVQLNYAGDKNHDAASTTVAVIVK